MSELVSALTQARFDRAWRLVFPVSCYLCLLSIGLSLIIPWQVSIPLAFLSWLPAPVLLLTQRWVRRRHPVQCAGAVYSHYASPPERCAYPEGHEGRCEP